MGSNGNVHIPSSGFLPVGAVVLCRGSNENLEHIFRFASRKKERNHGLWIVDRTDDIQNVI